MSSENEVKPTPIWPVTVAGLILGGIFSTSNVNVMGGAFLGILIVATIIHKRNKKYFGDEYLKNPQPTEEAKKKLKKNKYNLTSKQKLLVNVITILGIGVGFLFSGLITALILGAGLGMISLSGCMFWNKSHVKKATILLIFGALLTILALWSIIFGTIFTILVLWSMI